MINETSAIYQGEDNLMTVDFVDMNFADLTDVIVGIVINKQLQKTMKKSLNTVTAVAGAASKCAFKITRAETKEWPSGYMTVEVTAVQSSPDFPSGKHIPYQFAPVKFENLYTKNS